MKAPRKRRGKWMLDKQCKRRGRKNKSRREKKSHQKGREGVEEVENKGVEYGRQLLFLQTLHVFLLLPAAFLCRDLRKKSIYFSIKVLCLYRYNTPISYKRRILTELIQY